LEPVKLIPNILSLFAITLLPVVSHAQAPELSADEPIAYTADNGILIATGNAVYRDVNTLVQADEIRYDRVKNQIDASGNVRVTREGLRLLTQHLVYDTEAKTVQSGPFRAGFPPLFIEGESFSGTLDEIDFSKVSVYFREPSKGSPRLQVEKGSWKSGESVSGSGLRLNAIGGLKIPLPAFEYEFGSPTADLDATLGFRNSLGAYAQTRLMYPLNRQLAIGGNLDIFTRRGILVGPAFEWQRTDGTLSIQLDSGWIHDHDSEERGADLLGERIEQSRGFAKIGIRANRDNRIQLLAQANYISDSELYRDFRRREYFENYQPDHFIDFTLQEADFLLNVFARRQLNDAYGMVERLPEIQAEWLPTTLGETGILVQASAGATRYRKIEVTNLPPSFLFPDAPLGLHNQGIPADGGFPDLVESPYHNRLDGSVTLTRPFKGPMGTQVVLRAGSRWTQYRMDSTDSLPSTNEDRWVSELGFDISKSVARTYQINRPDWNLSKLRHISKINLQYRWHPDGDDLAGSIPDFDGYAFIARRPVLDLSDIRHTDGLREWNVMRIGWENKIMAAGEDGAFRDYLSLNLYQDIDFSADPGEDEWDALYTELDYQPFPWLNLQWRQKFHTERTETDAAYFRATLSSADLWSATLQAEYLRGGIEQYELAARYRLSENLGLIGYWHYDAKLDTFTRQQYGFSRRVANTWQLEMYVAFNNENNRDDSFSVGMRLRWLAF
jgi:LPS-assembly protein